MGLVFSLVSRCRLDFSISAFDMAQLALSTPVRIFACFGSSPSVFGQVRLDFLLLVFDFMNVEFLLFLHTHECLAFAMLIFGAARADSMVSFLDFVQLEFSLSLQSFGLSRLLVLTHRLRMSRLLSPCAGLSAPGILAINKELRTFGLFVFRVLTGSLWFVRVSSGPRVARFVFSFEIYATTGKCLQSLQRCQSGILPPCTGLCPN